VRWPSLDDLALAGFPHDENYARALLEEMIVCDKGCGAMDDHIVSDEDARRLKRDKEIVRDVCPEELSMTMKHWSNQCVHDFMCYRTGLLDGTRKGFRVTSDAS